MDKENFSKMYLNYFEPLCLYVFRFFPEKDEAHDIVQDIMLKMWEKSNNIIEIDNIEKYLYRAVHNSCINKLENLKVQKKYTNYKQIRLLEIELEDFEGPFSQWEIREKINSEVNNLTPQEKIIFEFRYLEYKKYKEIATLLNISVRTVETHLQKSIKYLRNRLKEIR